MKRTPVKGVADIKKDIDALLSLVEQESVVWRTFGLKVKNYPIIDILPATQTLSKPKTSAVHLWKKLALNVRLSEIERYKQTRYYLNLWKYAKGMPVGDMPVLNTMFSISPEEYRKVEMDALDQLASNE